MENELDVVNAEIIKSLQSIKDWLAQIDVSTRQGSRSVEERLVQIDLSIREGARSLVISNELTQASLRRIEALIEGIQ